MTHSKLYQTKLNREETREIIDLLRLRRRFVGINLKELKDGVDEFVMWHKLRQEHASSDSFNNAFSAAKGRALFVKHTSLRERMKKQRTWNRASVETGEQADGEGGDAADNAGEGGEGGGGDDGGGGGGGDF